MNNYGLYSDCKYYNQDFSMLEFLKKKLPKKGKLIILDVGANDGRDTIHYLKNFSSSKVYSFEPDPRAIKYFQLNLKKYPKSRWKLFKGALADFNGKNILNMAFKNGKDWSLSSSIVDISKECGPKLKFNKQIEVDVTTLDNWYSEDKELNNKKIDFIHTDLQGSEKMFIDGAKETLKNTGLILLECNETSTYLQAMSEKETIKVMNDLNFKCIFKHSNDLLFENLNK